MTATLPFNWKVPAGRALQTALNRALALDADTRAELAALDGRGVELHLASPPLALRVTVTGDALEIGPVAEDARTDLSVRATLGGLLRQLPMLRGEDASPVGRLRIEGDAELARRLQRMAERFDPDWARPLTVVFGEVLGMQIANGFAFALKRARVAGAAFAGSAADWLTEESREVVGREEQNAFHDDVDALRDDVERMAARVARLKAGV
ncbi:SCP2 domain-containing protein [Lysobacter pythonis]|uniref:Ubiquinone biosynthesis accessory factor UbiJ n=1 Tax=Solilutibacter pythonis TaxID=2483112 RepID=A0A3M2HTU4_9GAMM|nr:SCP2 sterol-binding domain-containing protein [Lysobacter pythonis]RMH93156.1 SCP2 domain-containing protein [Lysobacter pythonis]